MLLETEGEILGELPIRFLTSIPFVEVNAFAKSAPPPCSY